MSDLGRLSECLVDNDPAARVRARRLRSKALVLSIALEALMLAALLLWPLITPGVLTAHYIVTPAPPYSGGGAAHQGQPTIHRLHVSSAPAICLAVALRRFVRSPQQIVRRLRTSARTRAAEATDRAFQARVQTYPEELEIASSFPNRRTPSRLMCGRHYEAKA